MMGSTASAITAVDIFGYSSFQDIVITKQAAEAIENVAQDISEDQPIYVMDDLDTDDDGFANEDEIACGSDPNTPNLIDDPGATPAIPGLLYSAQSIYTEGEKIGKYKPDCLNRDIDGDGLPNWWEEQYYSGSPTADWQTAMRTRMLATIPVSMSVEPIRPFLRPSLLPWKWSAPSTTRAMLTTTNPLTWLPKFGHTLMIQATWTGDSGSIPDEAVFSLSQTSSHPGTGCERS